jgi:hypothetical protein
VARARGEGDTVAIEPAGVSARVRNVQVHGVTVDAATAGQRTALALHGLSRDDLSRGDWVLAPGSLAPSTLVTPASTCCPTCRSRCLPHARARAPWRRRGVARIVLLEGETLERATARWRQLRSNRPGRGAGRSLRAAFVLAMRTLGGAACSNRRPRSARRGVVEGLEVEDADERLVLALRKSGPVPVARRPGAGARGRRHRRPALVAGGDAICCDGRFSRGRTGRGARPHQRRVRVYAKAYPLRGAGALRAQGARRPLRQGPVFELALASCSRKA